MKKILVPTDFTEFSNCGISSAASLARKSGGELILFHVMEKDEDRSKIEEKMGLIEDSGTLKRVSLNSRIVQGDVIKSIAKEPCDVIVIGDREVHGLKGFFTSNIAEKVAKNTKKPVITVKQHTDLGNVQSIVYPTDMRMEQEKIIDEIKKLQKFFGAHLHLIKVYSDIMIKPEEVEKRLIGFAEFNHLKNYSVTARDNVSEGDEIISFADELGADLIAMATHDRVGLERLIGGYISGGLLRECKKAIWTKVIND